MEQRRGTAAGKRERAERRRARRSALAGGTAIGLVSVVLLAWGCSDDEPAGGPRVNVDPGGTYGAEVTMSVLGRGRVTGNIPGLECPGECFGKYVFASAAAQGALAGVTLKATPTAGSRFKGWRFATEPIGSRGRGPETCNPILRPAIAPAVDLSAAEVFLPFGEVDGAPPTGREGACSAYTKVPAVYRVTAEFETDPAPPDAGPDSGPDGGTTDILYTPPTAATTTAQDIGLTDDGYLYWRFSGGGGAGIAYGANPQGPMTQPPSVILEPSAGLSISVFEVDPRGLVYQTSAGVFLVRAGAQTSMAAGPGTCVALAVDANQDVYCRTFNSIVRWTLASGYAAATVLFSGLPSGNDLAVDVAAGRLYFSSSTAINTLPLAEADGGVLAPTAVVSGRSSPNHVEVDAVGARLWWVESASVQASSGVTAPATATPTNATGTTSSLRLARDPADPSYFWVSSSSSIYRAYYLGGGSTQVWRSGVIGLTGVAVDGTYVYWTQNDGRVRRAARTP